MSSPTFVLFLPYPSAKGLASPNGFRSFLYPLTHRKLLLRGSGGTETTSTFTCLFPFSSSTLAPTHPAELRCGARDLSDVVSAYLGRLVP